jgi:hypothetical protein
MLEGRPGRRVAGLGQYSAAPQHAHQACYSTEWFNNSRQAAQSDMHCYSAAARLLIPLYCQCLEAVLGSSKLRRDLLPLPSGVGRYSYVQACLLLC